MSGEFMTYETYLRQQVDKGCYGVAIISAEIALDIANFIEKQRERIAEADRKTEPQPENLFTDKYGDVWEWRGDAWYCISGQDEPQTETEMAKAIVHKMIDDAVIAEDAYPELRQKMHDAVDEYEPQDEPQTERRK